MVAVRAGNGSKVVRRWSSALSRVPVGWLRLRWHIYISVTVPRENGVGHRDVEVIVAAY